MRSIPFLPIVGLALLVVLAGTPAAGEPLVDTIPLAGARINLAVPDIPAFGVLDTTPSPLLRPTSIKDLTATLAGLVAEQDLAIPRRLALEVAPWLLFRGQSPAVGEYRRGHVLYSTRLSLGIAPQDPGAGSRIGVGLRTTFVNRNELALSPGVRDTLIRLLQPAGSFYHEQFTGCFTDIDPNGDDDAARAWADQAFLDRCGVPFSGYGDTVPARLASAVGWNRMQVDGAMAVLMTTSDSLGGDLKVPRPASGRRPHSRSDAPGSSSADCRRGCH